VTWSYPLGKVHGRRGEREEKKKGFGMAFTLGRGNRSCRYRSIRPQTVGREGKGGRRESDKGLGGHQCQERGGGRVVYQFTRVTTLDKKRENCMAARNPISVPGAISVRKKKGRRGVSPSVRAEFMIGPAPGEKREKRVINSLNLVHIE